MSRRPVSTARRAAIPRTSGGRPRRRVVADCLLSRRVLSGLPLVGLLLVGLVMAAAASLGLAGCRRAAPSGSEGAAAPASAEAAAAAGAGTAEDGEPSAAPALRRRSHPPPGVPTRFHAVTGRVDVFEIPLQRGQYLLASAEQLGADVYLTLYGPDGGKLLQVDRPTHDTGLERLPWVARTGGPHRLEIEVFEEPGADWGGDYRLRVQVRPGATEGELGFLAATRARARAEGSAAAGREEEAEAAYREAAAGFRALGEEELEVEVLDFLGALLVASTERGAHLRALEVWRRAEELYRDLGNRRDVARSLNFQADALVPLGRSDEAMELLSELISYARDHGVADEEASAHNDLAILLSDHGDSERAVEHLERALDLYRGLGRSIAVARVLRLLGYEYTRLGMVHQAVAPLEEAIALYRRLGFDPAGLARTLTTASAAYRDLGELDRAEEALREALALRRVAGDRLGEAVTITFLHEISARRGQWDAARRDLLEALSVFRQEKHEPQIANTLGLLGWLELEAGEPSRAGRYFQDALAILEHSVDRRGEANARLGLGKALADRGRLRAGLEQVEFSVRAIEDMRQGATSRTLRNHHLAHRYGHHDVRVEILMRLHGRNPDAGWDRRALAAVEEARARGLLDELTRRQGAAPAEAGRARAEEPAEELADELAEELERLEGRRTRLLWEGAEPDALREVERRMAEVELAWQRAEGRWRRLSGRSAVPSVLGVDGIQGTVLAPDDLLLAYHLGSERSFLWVVRRERFEVHELPPREEIAALARRAHRLTADSRRRTRAGPARRALAALADRVLAPAAAHLGGGARLLVMADGPLLYVPFAALPIPGRADPLVAEHEVVQVPSASALAALRRRTAARPAPEGVLALFADPVFGPGDPRLAGKAPQDGGRSEALRRSGESLDRLAHSAREAAAILALAPPGPRLAAFGFDAHRDRFLAGDLDRYRFVHLATHARVYADRPAASGLYLSRLRRDGSSRAGVLREWDLYRLELPAQLVTLSACRTALGKELRGEGLVGFTQGFFTAGAERVLVSLWDVGDESTAVLMERFYRQLFQEGRSPAAALRAAQLSMWQEERWSSPYHWAGFVLQGEPGAVSSLGR